MTGVRNETVCWAPECGAVVPPPRRGVQGRYCSPAHRIKALRRNGGKAPSEPYPPLEPGPVLPSKPPEVSGPVSHPKSEPAPARGKRKPPPAPRPEEKAAGGDSTGAPEPPAATVTHLHVAVTEDATVPVKVTVHPMVAAYRADLDKIGQADTRQGLQVIEMAEKLVSSATSPAAAANLSKELQRLMGELEAGTLDALVNLDPSLVIRDRTLAKLRALSEPAGEATA